jgi:hypothetical protein
MTKRYKAFLITIITIIILFMAGRYLLNFLFEDLCGNDIKQRIPSPNGENIAYIFDRSCGATTGFSPQLSILYKGDELENESGNSFRSEKDFSIEWLDEKNLKVIYDISSETYEMKKKVNGITIEYIGK